MANRNVFSLDLKEVSVGADLQFSETKSTI